MGLSLFACWELTRRHWLDREARWCAFTFYSFDTPTALLVQMSSTFPPAPWELLNATLLPLFEWTLSEGFSNNWTSLRSSSLLWCPGFMHFSWLEVCLAAFEFGHTGPAGPRRGSTALLTPSPASGGVPNSHTHTPKTSCLSSLRLRASFALSSPSMVSPVAPCRAVRPL